jgi:hypothetical protein
MLRDILAIEVTATALRCLRLRPLALGGGPPAFTEHPLAPGIVVPTLGAPNVRDEAAFGRALAEAVGRRPPRWARLVLPDRAVCLRVLRTEAGMTPGADLRPFLVWRLQDALPFPAREARLAYVAAPNGRPGRQMVLTLLGWERVVSQYERLCAAAGFAVCHTAPAAWHLFHGGQSVAPPGEGVTAFLALGREATTLFLTRGGTPYYVRTFQPSEDPTGLVQELQASFAHAEDDLGLSPPARLTVAGEARTEAIRAALQAGLGVPCTALVLGASRRGSDRLPAGAQALLAGALAGTPKALAAEVPGPRGVVCGTACQPPGGVCPPECHGLPFGRVTIPLAGR